MVIGHGMVSVCGINTCEDLCAMNKSRIIIN